MNILLKNKHFGISILLLLAVKQLTWSGFIPLWQFPDEQAHFAQVQNLVEEGVTFSTNPGATTSKEVYESEVLLGTVRDDLGNNKYTYHPEYNLEYTNSVQGKLESAISNFPPQFRHERIIKEATGYPPLFYQLSSLGYRLSYNQDLFTRVFVTRLVNLLLFILFYVVVYLIGRELFINRQFAFWLALLVVFQPMFSFVMAGVNSDNLFNLLFTTAIFISLRLLNRGWQVSTLLLALVNLFLIMKTKPHGILVALIYLFPLIYLFLQKRRVPVKYVVVIAVILFVGFGRVVADIARGGQVIPEIGQFNEMPPLSIDGYMVHLKNVLVQSYRLILPWYWGVFRWLSLTYPRLVHRVINVITLVGLAGLLMFMRQIFSSPPRSLVKPKLFFFLVYASGVYFLTLTVFDYVFTKTYGFSFGFQGRYFFPLISAHIALLFIGIATCLGVVFKMPLNFTRYLVIGMIALHMYAQYFVIASYYHSEDLANFFLKASQYKPWFFKTPFLEIMILILLYITSLTVFKIIRINESKH